MKKVFICIAIFSLLAVASSTFAQEQPYELLENLPGNDQQSMRLPEYITAIYNFGMGAVGIAALFMITIGGFWYLTAAGNTSQLGTAKNIIYNALFGLVGALFAWLLLYIINPDLVQIDLSSITNPGQVASTVAQSSTTGSAIFGVAGSTKGTCADDCSNAELGPGCKVPTPAPTGAEATTRSQLKAMNIEVNRSVGCPTGVCYQNTNGCTSVAGLSREKLQTLRNNAKTGFTITGGTEDGHASHGGPNIVDLRVGNATLDSYIRSGTKGKAFSNYDCYKKDGMVFVYETKNAHWHVDMGGALRCN